MPPHPVGQWEDSSGPGARPPLSLVGDWLFQKAAPPPGFPGAAAVDGGRRPWAPLISLPGVCALRERGWGQARLRTRTWQAGSSRRPLEEHCPGSPDPQPRACLEGGLEVAQDWGGRPVLG